MMRLVIILNLLVALWVFYDAQKKGFTLGKSLLWAMGVFFLLIIFLPLYLIVRQKKMRWKAEQASPYASTNKICFYCGKPYTGDPERCPNCGQSLKSL